MKSSRLVAFEVLHKIFTDDAYSNIELDKALSKISEDKAFVSALVYGTVERRITLDYFIDKYLSSKPKPKVMTILRLGTYQLLFMDKVPDSAAINESVKLAKDIKQDYYSKLINAVLHKIAEDKFIPDDLSIKYSVPANLINMWTKQYGVENVNNILNCINQRPPVFAIPNRKFVDNEELLYELQLEGVECELYQDIVKVNSAINFSTSTAYNSGLFYIEDLSCYECVKQLNPAENDVLIDVCAAPGGKSFSIANCINDNGTIYSFDIHNHRVKLIEDGAKRLELKSIIPSINDALIYNEKLPKADKILCDVPCSGFGIIRRKPEIRYKDLDSIKELPSLQLSILTTSARYLKKGGYIMYSTCTLNKKENERVVEEFLTRNKDFTLLKEKTIFPSADGGDGFYYALLKYED